MLRSVTWVGLVLASGGAMAQGPSFDCAKAESGAEKLICGDADLAALDRLVAARYAAAVKVVRGLDSGAAEAEAGLRTEQRGWIKGRDDCWKDPDPRACVERAHLSREGQLVARWGLEKPAEVVEWACGGNPSNRVVTSFFATTLPAVLIERGDSVAVGSLVPTAAGRRYEASFGRSIAIDGDTATYRDPDPDGVSYNCTRAGTS